MTVYLRQSSRDAAAAAEKAAWQEANRVTGTPEVGPFVQVPSVEWNSFSQWAALTGRTQNDAVVPADVYSLYKSTLARVGALARGGTATVSSVVKAPMSAWWEGNDLEGRMIWDRRNFPAAYPLGALGSAPQSLYRAFYALANGMMDEDGLSKSAAYAAVGRLRMSAADKARIFGFSPTQTSTYAVAKAIARAQRDTRVIEDPLKTQLDTSTGKTFPTGTTTGRPSGGFVIHEQWQPGAAPSSEAPGSDPEIIWEYDEDDYGVAPATSTTTWLLVAAAVGGAFLLLRGK